MKFTFEVEQNDKLCFCTNFNSFIPMIYKCGLIHSLLFRVFNIEHINEETETLKTILRKNCYPKSLIDSCIQIFLYNIFEKKLIHPTVPKKELYIPLQYLGVQSLQVKRRLL